MFQDLIILSLLALVYCRPSHNHDHHHRHNSTFDFGDFDEEFEDYGAPGFPHGPESFPVSDQNRIVFPESDVFFRNSTGDPGPIKPPKCANGQIFCEDVDGYPYEHLSLLLKNASVDKNFFGVENIPVDVGSRNGEQDENFICPGTDKVIYPKVGTTKDDKMKYIVNVDEDSYVQGIRVEICVNPGGTCKFLGEPPAGYIVGCKQKYMYRKLLSLSDKGTAVPDTFKLPSACCCSYKKDPDFPKNLGRRK